MSAVVMEARESTRTPGWGINDGEPPNMGLNSDPR